jgi:hypothetical protein
MFQLKNTTMKKIMFTVAGSLIMSLVVVYGQDSTRTNNRTQQKPTQSVTQPTTPTQQPSQQSQYRMEDRVTIQQNQLPSSLRETLNGQQYKGWESSTIYQDRATGEYYYDAPGTSTTTTPQRYRFDRNGKEISDKDKQNGFRKDNQ